MTSFNITICCCTDSKEQKLDYVVSVKTDTLKSALCLGPFRAREINFFPLSQTQPARKTFTIAVFYAQLFC